MIRKQSGLNRKNIFYTSLLAVTVSISFLSNMNLAQAIGVPIQSNTVADLAEAIAPAVVNIEVNQMITQPVNAIYEYAFW